MTIANKKTKPIELGTGKLVLVPIRSYVSKFFDRKTKELKSERKVTGLNEIWDGNPGFSPSATHCWVRLPEGVEEVG